jgi:HD-like signal output (HDOD) protein
MLRYKYSKIYRVFQLASRRISEQLLRAWDFPTVMKHRICLRMDRNDWPLADFFEKLRVLREEVSRPEFSRKSENGRRPAEAVRILSVYLT